MKRSVLKSLAGLSLIGGAFLLAGAQDQSTDQTRDTIVSQEAPIDFEPLDDVPYLVEPVDRETGFAANAFPPTIPDTNWHQDSWLIEDCLRCHETGVENAPLVRHETLPDILLAVKCRTCHVIEPGKVGIMSQDAPDPDINPHFADNAFPPMIPNSRLHEDAWTINDCLMCHEDGTMGAPKVIHDGLPPMLMEVKCRTCHVQVRAIDADSP